MTERLLTLDQVAERLQVAPSERRLKRLITKCGVPYRRIGGQWRLTEADCRSLLEATKQCSISATSP